MISFARGAHHLPELAQLPGSSEWTLSKYSKSEHCFAQSITAILLYRISFGGLRGIE